jgi:hypothetical protein
MLLTESYDEALGVCNLSSCPRLGLIREIGKPMFLLVAQMVQLTSIADAHILNPKSTVLTETLIRDRNELQYRLISLPTGHVDPSLLCNDDREHLEHGCCPGSALTELTRLAACVYSDIALYPMPWKTGIRPRLAQRMRRIWENSQVADRGASNHVSEHWISAEHRLPDPAPTPLSMINLNARVMPSRCPQKESSSIPLDPAYASASHNSISSRSTPLPSTRSSNTIKNDNNNHHHHQKHPPTAFSSATIRSPSSSRASPELQIPILFYACFASLHTTHQAFFEHELLLALLRLCSEANLVLGADLTYETVREGVLRGFLWWDVVCERPGRELWGRVVERREA